jgi:hypothetical protein
MDSSGAEAGTFNTIIIHRVSLTLARIIVTFLLTWPFPVAMKSRGKATGTVPHYHAQTFSTLGRCQPTPVDQMNGLKLLSHLQPRRSQIRLLPRQTARQVTITSKRASSDLFSQCRHKKYPSPLYVHGLSARLYHFTQLSRLSAILASSSNWSTWTVTMEGA